MVILKILCFCLFINFITPLKLVRYLNHSILYKNHGSLIGYFTFSGKGVAGMNYTITPFLNLTDINISVFPTAFDPFINLNRIKKFYSQNACREFYRKAIYSVRLSSNSDRLPLGRFSGGFAIAIVISNRYSCLPLLKRLHTEEIVTTPFKIEMTLFNPDENGMFIDHLSAVDQDMISLLYFLLILYVAMGFWTIYSIKITNHKDVVLMLKIQKVIAAIVLLQIAIHSILIYAYRSLQIDGYKWHSLEILADLLAQIVKYLEFYIIISWTLSSNNNNFGDHKSSNQHRRSSSLIGQVCCCFYWFVSRSGDRIARIVGCCGIVQVLLTILHYSTISLSTIVASCVSVWECESHEYSVAGWGIPRYYSSSDYGWLCVLAGWTCAAFGSMFVLHLVKLGLASLPPYQQQSTGPITLDMIPETDNTTNVRRAYVSVFCSAAFFWFWSYGAAWLLASLVSDYYQYKFMVLSVSLCHIIAMPAVLRVTRFSPQEFEKKNLISVSPPSVIVWLKLLRYITKRNCVMAETPNDVDW